MLYGYIGRLLFVDLSNRECHDEPLDEHLCRHFLGGYGLGARILYERMSPKVDPLGADNILGLLTGPLTGTPAMCSGRFAIMAKSPLTGTWGDANCGGDLGPILKFSGYDGVFFSGISSSPVYLYIENGKVKLIDASEIWGKDCLDTEDMLKAKHGSKTSVACIGPSGENLSLIAAVIHDMGRAAARSGLGAVMGAKKLKAVAVQGDTKVLVADELAVKKLRQKWLKQLKGKGPQFKQYGTAIMTEGNVMIGDTPIKNWAGSGPDDFPTVNNIGGDAVIAEQERTYGCWQCPIRCGGHMKVKPGRARVSHKPEYETLSMAGALNLNDDLESIIKFNDICNAYGLDTISAGSAVGFAMECYENGIINKQDAGMELHWGDGNAVVELVKKIAKREGIGDLLADGVMRAAAKIGGGADQYAIHVQGQELPAHDPRFVPSLGVTYRLDATPGRHTQGGRAWIMGMDWITDDRKDKYDYTNTGYLQKKAMNMMHVVNSAGLCLFGYTSYPVQYIPEFLSMVTGLEYSLESCLAIGERIANMRHLFNLREGCNPLKYSFSPRALGKPPMTRGPLAGVTLDDKIMIQDYLREMDWDTETTEPSMKKLQELGLSELINRYGD